VVFYGASGNADVWYVLQPYNTGNGNCPSGWQSNASNCYQEETNQQVSIGSLPASSLQALSVSAVAGNPNITMTISAGSATVKSIGVPNLIGLGSGWTDAEFNVFGDGGGDRANFAGTPTIQVQTEVQTASTSGLSCINTGNTNSSTLETNSLNLVPNCCLVSGDAITFLESGVNGQACTLCGGQGQTCCSVGTGCNSSGDVCYGGSCAACGGNGQPCCTNEQCGSGLVCQAGDCGVADGLSLSPSSISAAAADGQGLSVNYASTELTLTGAWGGSGAAPSIEYAGLPSGANCTPSTGTPPDDGPTRITCTTSYYTPQSPTNDPYHVVVTANLSPYNSISTTLDLTVTACQPLTCSDISYTCGSLDNGCGTTLNCGTCPSGDSCVAGTCARTCTKRCPSPEYLDPYSCECESCKCGIIIVDGHDLCNVCKP